MYDFNRLRRTVKEKCKKRVTFKRAAFLQKIIDKEKWTGREILKIIKGELTWVPYSDVPRNFISDALTFGTIVNKKNGNDFEYVRCIDPNRNDESYCIIIFPRKNLKENAKRIYRMSKLKAFL